MTQDEANKIKAIWDECEEFFGDRSTEWLLGYVAALCQQRNIRQHCDDADVAEALLLTCPDAEIFGVFGEPR